MHCREIRKACPAEKEREGDWLSTAIGLHYAAAAGTDSGRECALAARDAFLKEPQRPVHPS